MTEQGLRQVFAIMRGVWPTTEHTPEMTHAWRLKLDRYDDDRVKRAVFDLADNEQWQPSIAQVIERCRAIGRENAQRLDAQRRQLADPPSPDVVVTDDHRDQADAHLARYGFASHGPMRDALARHLARGGTLTRDADTPPDARRLPAGARGWCTSCSGALLGYDPVGGDICRNCDPEYRRNYSNTTRKAHT